MKTITFIEVHASTVIIIIKIEVKGLYLGLQFSESSLGSYASVGW